MRRIPQPRARRRSERLSHPNIAALHDAGVPERSLSARVPPATVSRLAMYSAVSERLYGAKSQRSVTRCFN